MYNALLVGISTLTHEEYWFLVFHFLYLIEKRQLQYVFSTDFTYML